MKHQLKYLKLFEALTPDEIPYSKFWSDGKMGIKISPNVKELPPVFNELTDDVTWWLIIDDTKSLTEVTGFNNLTEIDRYLRIQNNESLTEVTGFNNLTQVGSTLSIEYNELLTEVTGFNNLKQVGAGLYIQNNKSLTSVTGFYNLTQVDGYLWIQNNPKLVAMSIPVSLVRSVDYSKKCIYYDNNLRFKSPPEFINSPVIIDDLVSKFNPVYHNTQVIKQIIDNLEEWGTQDTKDKVYSHLGQYLTPEQLTKAPDHIQHLYHPDYKSTSGRDVAKLNTGQIYGIF